MTIWRDVRRTIAAALIGHAVIHLLGVMTAWRLSPFQDPAYTTLILNRTLDAGETGQLAMGGAWLLAAVALSVAALALWRDDSQARPLVAAAFAISLAVGLAGLPASRLGVVIDLAVLATIAAASVEPRVERSVHKAVAAGRRPHIGGSS